MTTHGPTHSQHATHCRYHTPSTDSTIVGDCSIPLLANRAQNCLGRDTSILPISTPGGTQAWSARQLCADACRSLCVSRVAAICGSRPRRKPLIPTSFYNFYVADRLGRGQPVQLYVSPLAHAAVGGHTWITYPPLMPHEFLYHHHRAYYKYYHNGGWTCATRALSLVTTAPRFAAAPRRPRNGRVRFTDTPRVSTPHSTC